MIEVTLVFKFPWKHVERGRIIEMHRAVQRRITPGKESTHMVSMLVNTEETAAQLMQRIRDRTMDVCPIEGMWAQEIGADATGYEPAFDPFAFRVLTACNVATDRNEAKDLGKRRTRDGRIKDRVQQLDRGAQFEVGFRLPGERKPIT
ncbi:hypothetical protein [uncultured Methylobacterium sp.]|uniref:hypothetical protein n=1 Tax=uncultured Methylobacterium sp. TaxID=157278 RepID=UPI0035CBCCE2